MEVKSLVWLGMRTEKFDETVKLFRDVMGIAVTHEEPTFTVLSLANGDQIEVFQPSDQEHTFFTTGPVAGFEVSDLDQARAELEAAGIEFIGPIQRWGDGYGWSHFRGPDGNVYEITSIPPRS